jgi:hypothetical protein
MEREPDPYWNDDRVLGEVYFGHDHRLVRARSHTEDEVFRGRGSETLFTLTEREGQRTYIQSRLYIHAPPGTTREQRVADAQAWYYPADRTVVLWELLLEPPVQRIEDPREDLLLRGLWVRYEHFLTARFPGADQLLTTWEDTYDRDQWAGFLGAIGYRQIGPAVFRKPARLPDLGQHHACRVSRPRRRLS